MTYPTRYVPSLRSIERRWRIVDGDAENSVKAAACSYFQDLLSQVIADTVIVRVVEQKDAKLPDDWTYINDSEVALVDDNGVAISLFNRRDLEFVGCEVGEYVACAVLRGPYHGDNCKFLSVLMSDFAAEHQDEISERKRMSRLMGMDMPLGLDYAEVNIDGVEWQLDHHPDRKLHTGSTRWLPVPKGSKAKPHIVLSLDGVDAREITGRNMCYGAFAAHVGEQPVACVSLQRESLASNSSIYYKIMVAYK
ncbi:hypothetical protein QUV94_00955 [Collinsella intestinalis]|nr:hypothetical protein [Collinsella intestinalis]